MKHFAQVERNRTVVCIGEHDVLHLRPPLPARFGFSDFLPQLFGLNLGVSKQSISAGIEKDRIIAHAIFLKLIVQLRTNRIMACLIRCLVVGLERHDEGLANHNGTHPSGVPDGTHASGVPDGLDQKARQRRADR